MTLNHENAVHGCKCLELEVKFCYRSAHCNMGDISNSEEFNHTTTEREQNSTQMEDVKRGDNVDKKATSEIL